jgi:hypothetical protein
MHNQAPFSTIHPSGFVGYPYPVDVGDMSGDGKQRKRRGNLPKETTDTLRAWFRENLGHPYPSEEEKQRLMKATGLQMSEFCFSRQSVHRLIPFQIKSQIGSSMPDDGNFPT